MLLQLRMNSGNGRGEAISHTSDLTAGNLEQAQAAQLQRRFSVIMQNKTVLMRPVANAACELYPTLLQLRSANLQAELDCMRRRPTGTSLSCRRAIRSRLEQLSIWQSPNLGLQSMLLQLRYAELEA